MTTSLIARDSREGKRNRKTQALSALLSASALGLFLEGCGGADEPSSGGAGGGGRSNINPILATSAPEAHIGGTGIDTVSYEDSNAGVVVDLLEGTGTGGFAAGDTFENIKNLIGSDYADTLAGNEEANTSQEAVAMIPSAAMRATISSTAVRARMNSTAVMTTMNSTAVRATIDSTAVWATMSSTAVRATMSSTAARVRTPRATRTLVVMSMSF